MYFCGVNNLELHLKPTTMTCNKTFTQTSDGQSVSLEYFKPKYILHVKNNVILEKINTKRKMDNAIKRGDIVVVDYGDGGMNNFWPESNV